MNTIYDLIYSHADAGYIAVPRNNSKEPPRQDLWTFDSRQGGSGLSACTKIPTEEILAVLRKAKDKWDRPLVE